MNIAEYFFIYFTFDFEKKIILECKKKTNFKQNNIFITLKVTFKEKKYDNIGESSI